MNTSRIADTIEGAVDLMIVKGRCRGTMVADDGSICVVQAIKEAGRSNDSFWDTLMYLNERLADEHLNDGTDQVCLWNDSLADDSVIFDTLREVAKELRNA